MTLTATQDYREFLAEELESRRRKNPKYSLRAFARDLGISAPRLSEVLGRRGGFSRAAAEKVALRLSMPSDDRELFCDLVDSVHARSPKDRELARARVRKHVELEYPQLREDSFRLMSDWYHLAILELMELPGARAEPRWVANALGISADEAREALATLGRLGMLAIEGETPRPLARFISAPDGVPSASVRKFHLGMLTKARDALQQQTIEERDFSAMVMSIDPRKMNEAKAMIRRFRRRFNREMDNADGKDSVYCLGVQFFRLAAPGRMMRVNT